MERRDEYLFPIFSFFLGVISLIIFILIKVVVGKYFYDSYLENQIIPYLGYIPLFFFGAWIILYLIESTSYKLEDIEEKEKKAREEAEKREIERQREVEIKRIEALEAEQRRIEEEEKRRIEEEEKRREAEQRKQQEEAERERLAAIEEKRKRIEAEATERQRKIEEIEREQARLAAMEAERRRIEALEAEEKRRRMEKVMMDTWEIEQIEGAKARGKAQGLAELFRLQLRAAMEQRRLGLLEDQDIFNMFKQFNANSSQEEAELLAMVKRVLAEEGGGQKSGFRDWLFGSKSKKR